MMSQNSSVLSSMSLGNKNNKYIYSDEQLMMLFQGGNENAYIELVNRYKDKLINFIFNYLGDIESSEDVVQETMIKLYQKKHYYKEIAKFSTWLYTIAKNLANTELRKRKQRKTTLLSQFSKDDKMYDLPSNDNEVGQEIQTEIQIDRGFRGFWILAGARLGARAVRAARRGRRERGADALQGGVQAPDGAARRVLSRPKRQISRGAAQVRGGSTPEGRLG